MDAHREPSKPRRKRPKPKAVASKPGELWVWDITLLPTTVRGRFVYLYLVLDLFSRKIVAWRVHAEEDGLHAARLMEEAIVDEGLAGQGLTLHSDNGAAMKSSTLKGTLERLGVARSFSRPRVSNDNAYAESSFRTMKYRPNYPRRPKEGVEDWSEWVEKFVQWYNEEHRHSGIGMVTPSQRHSGEDVELLAKRRELYEQAKERTPRRWSGATRKWSRPQEVYLTPASAPSANETRENETRRRA